MTPLCVPPADSAKAASKPLAEEVVWWSPRPGLPNESEVLFFALLRLGDAANAAEAAEWAASVLRTSAAGSGERWPPSGVEWKSVA